MTTGGELFVLLLAWAAVFGLVVVVPWFVVRVVVWRLEAADEARELDHPSPAHDRRETPTASVSDDDPEPDGPGPFEPWGE